MYLVIYVRFPHMPVTGAGAVCIWSRHLCRSVPLLDQCSRDITALYCTLRGGGGGAGGHGAIQLLFTLLSSGTAVWSLQPGTGDTGDWNIRSVVPSPDSDQSRGEQREQRWRDLISGAGPHVSICCTRPPVPPHNSGIDENNLVGAIPGIPGGS